MSNTEANTKPELPSVADLKKKISVTGKDSKASQDAFESAFKSDSAKIQSEYAHLSGLIDHYEHKRLWSFFLMVLMLTMIGFQSFLLIKVGRGAWDFSDYEWLLPALLVQNLGQVVGLAVFVVRSLFK